MPVTGAGATNFDAGQRAIVERVALGHPLADILEQIVRLIESQGSGLLCSILLVDAEHQCVRNGASPNLPQEYVRLLDGIGIGPREGSCGAAAYLGERVIAEDIATHENWEKYRSLALPFGLRACWSTPIFSPDRQVLGTFAIYHGEVRGPTSAELTWVDAATHIAAIAILRDRTEAERKRLVFDLGERVKELTILHQERDENERALRQSEQRLRAVVEHTPDVAIQWYDESGRVLFCNHASERLFGWKAGEAVGKTLLELGFFDAREEALFEGHRKAAARGDKVQPTEFHYRRADGTNGYLLSTVFQIPFTRTESCYVCMDIDVTERRRMEESIRASETLRALIYSSVEDMIFYLKVEGEGLYRFISVNPAFLSTTGLAEKDVVGKLVAEVIPAPSLSLVLEKYEEALRTRRRVTWDEMTRYPTGLKQGEVTVCPISDADGQATHLVGTVHDVTARREAEEERRRLERQLQQSERLRSLGTFAGGIAHDFNNILTAVHANAELALFDLAEDHVGRRRILELQRASQRASELVRRILTFSKDPSPRREMIDLRATIDEVLELEKATLPKNVELKRQYDENIPQVAADPVQTHQVMMNLVTNAGHALRNKGGLIEIRLRHCKFANDEALPTPDLHAGEYVRLTVRDDGCGMDTATMQRVFDPFFSTKAEGEGTGLGLSTVHGILMAHGGAVTVESELGSGTTFSLYFPVSARTTLTARAEKDPGPKGEHVLYVDDEEALVFLAKRSLGRLGYRVTGHTDAAQALQDFRERPTEFDVVVTDISMPGLSGAKLAEAIRALRPDIPIVMLTGLVRSDDCIAAERLGIRHLAVKPLSAEDLAKTLSSLLRSPAHN